MWRNGGAHDRFPIRGADRRLFVHNAWCWMAPSRLDLTRPQILAFRRRVGHLDARLPAGRRELRSAAWAGLQDSVPRAALLSIHARVEDTGPNTWEDPSLVQIWGPRFSVYVVPTRDHWVFSLGRLPEDEGRRRHAEELAARLHALLGEGEMTYAEAGRALGVHPNQLRYAAPTGSVLVRWGGAGKPTIRIVSPPEADPVDARRELARRYLHIFGPSTPGAFAEWAGVGAPLGLATFDRLRRGLIPVQTPIGDAWILARDESEFRAEPRTSASARLIPSGDAYSLLQGEDRKLLVPDADRRRALWPSRVWPGAILVEGEIAGTWRRAKDTVTIQPWSGLTRSQVDLVAEEAASLPVPEVAGNIVVRWVK